MFEPDGHHECVLFGIIFESGPEEQMATPSSNKRKTLEDNSPLKRGNKKTKQHPQAERCVTCKKETKQDAVECQWCCKWEHRVCAGLSQNEYNMLSNSVVK